MDETDAKDNLQRKYGELSGEIVTVEIVLQDIEELVKTTKARGLGISLCGNRDLNQMAVLVCGLRPGGIADLDGRINVGDQLLELNDHVLYGRSHLNAAPIILSSYSSMLSKATDRSKQGNSQALRFVIRRLPENLTNLACPPITYPSHSPLSPLCHLHHGDDHPHSLEPPPPSITVTHITPVRTPQRPPPHTSRATTGEITSGAPSATTLTTIAPTTENGDSILNCHHRDWPFTSCIGLVGLLRIHRTKTGEAGTGAPTCTHLKYAQCPRTLTHNVGL
ncbi:unnamed protein product [Schistocephalus solidus]|uniref:PDZ domain-containing protein n=1 Tax=Schistocephalus solidus TaxID=70667 RepID=A0A183TKM4_SCHSO|nr:unnamed protein product [Schistocephalus solidus]